MHNTEYKMQNTEYKMQNMICKIQKQCSLTQVSCGETIQHNGRRCPLNVTGTALQCSFESFIYCSILSNFDLILSNLRTHYL